MIVREKGYWVDEQGLVHTLDWKTVGETYAYGQTHCGLSLWKHALSCVVGGPPTCLACLVETQP